MSADEELIEPVPGLRVRWTEGELSLVDDPGPEHVELLRTVSATFEDGRALALVAARPPEASGHGEEVVSAVLTDPDGQPVALAETLLSTQYDADRLIARAGLELWPTDGAYALRIAADRSSPPEGEPSRQTCSLTLRLSGIEGTGTYSLWDRR
jgi:hypothetical protein